MSSGNQDWEQVLSRLTAENTTKKKSTNIFVNSVITLLIMNSLSALAVMFLNTVINQAWENIDILRPGVGFVEAFSLTGLLWFLFMLKTGVVLAMGNSDDSD